MSENSDFLTVASLPDLVYERLRGEIASGVLHPGRLRISQLATRFGVSAIPIREALRLLEAEGLVSFRSNRSVVINSLQVSDVIEIFAIRAELECLALELSFPRLHDDLEALAELDRMVSQMDRELSSPDDWRTTNEHFHTALYSPSCSPRLLNMIGTLWVSVEPYLRLYVTASGSLRSAQTEHRALVSDARSSKIDDAKVVLRQHLKATRDVVIERLGSASDDHADASGP